MFGDRRMSRDPEIIEKENEIQRCALKIHIRHARERERRSRFKKDASRNYEMLKLNPVVIDMVIDKFVNQLRSKKQDAHKQGGKTGEKKHPFSERSIARPELVKGGNEDNENEKARYPMHTSPKY
jgi:hypothetical protein